MEEVNADSIIGYIKFFEYFNYIYDKYKFDTDSKSNEVLVLLYNSFNDDNQIMCGDKKNDVIILWLFDMIENLKHNIIREYNLVFDDELRDSNDIFYKNYKVIKEKLRYKILDAAVGDLILSIAEKTDVDHFVLKNISFFTSLTSTYAVLDVPDIKQKSSYLPRAQILSMVCSVLNRFDKSGRLSAEFLKYYESGKLVPYTDKNYMSISKIQGVEILPDNGSAFFDIDSEKIFYKERHNLFDVMAILHEFGHYLVRDIQKDNCINEVFSILLERLAIKYFISLNIDPRTISNCEQFRYQTLSENSEDILFTLLLMERKINHEPIIGDGDKQTIYWLLGNPDFSTLEHTFINDSIISEDAIINHFIDRQNSFLLSNLAYERIFDFTPYILGTYVSEYVIANGKENLLLEMLDQKELKWEEIFDALGLPLDRVILKK